MVDSPSTTKVEFEAWLKAPGEKTVQSALDAVANASASIKLPIEVPDKNGVPVVIRFATPEDVGAVESSIADHSGTGSGTGSDAFLIQEFTKRVVDPGFTWLFCTTADAKKEGLGMMAVSWSSPTESYWQSLRVAGTCRGRGIANILFKIAAQMCVAKQGPSSISRWGIVSNNEIMIGWSERLKLHGPQRFRRHGGEASETPPTMPAGLIVRVMMSGGPRMEQHLITVRQPA